MSMPLVNAEFVFTQPDGTRFRVRGTGDQHHAIFKTLDGYTVVRDQASGYYHYARLSDDGETLVPTGITAATAEPRLLDLNPNAQPPTIPGAGLPRTSLSPWEIRRRQRQSAMHISVTANMAAPPRRATVGQYVGLCPLVQFPDVPGTMSAAEVEAYCNKENYSGFENNGSVRDYFFDNSDGKLAYTNIVAPYYTTKHPRYYYTDEKIAYPGRAQELVGEVLAYHVASGFDFSHLSADSDHHIYAINVFYAGDVVNNYAQGLWPHSWHLSAPFNVGLGKLANDYQISNMGRELTLGTFCHENGHMICDFPDLYSPSDGWNGVGSFCLMSYGGIPPNEKNPTHICAYLRHAAGWTSTSNVISPRSNYSLRAGRNEFAIFSKNNAEYFIVENRERTGRDVGLSDSGLAVWHIDESGSNYDVGNSPSKQRECTLIQADSNQSIDDGTDLYPDGENNQLGDATTPNSKWLDGSSSGLDIQNVSSAGPSVTFSS